MSTEQEIEDIKSKINDIFYLLKNIVSPHYIEKLNTSYELDGELHIFKKENFKKNKQ